MSPSRKRPERTENGKASMNRDARGRRKKISVSYSGRASKCATVFLFSAHKKIKPRCLILAMNSFIIRLFVSTLLASVVTESRLSKPNPIGWRFRQCPIPPCLDPCGPCDAIGGTCITEPSYFTHFRRKCPGCPVLKSCDKVVELQVKCCDEKQPSDVECGRSGCTCCSNGDWVLGNSGPTLTAEDVCQRLDLEPSKPCSTSTTSCTDDVQKCDDGSFVGRDPNNNCKFMSCPNVYASCTQDVQECSDGSFVGRDPKNKCKFSACPSEQPSCGSTVCGAGLECCNASCGICVKPGNACIQMVCDPLH